MKGNRGIIVVLLASMMVLHLTGCTQKIPPKLNEKSNSIEISEEVHQIKNTPPKDQGKVIESERYYEEGLKLYGQYKYQDAVIAYDKAIAANPDNFKIYTSKGITLCFEGKYHEGMALIQKTLEMEPDYAPAFYDMAMGYKLQMNYNESLFWFKKTIQSDPKNTWSYYGIATIYADQSNTKDSLTYLKKAIELDPGVKAVARRQSHFDKMRNITEFQTLVQ